jgi:hypothetical protein
MRFSLHRPLGAGPVALTPAAALVVAGAQIVRRDADASSMTEARVEVRASA